MTAPRTFEDTLTDWLRADAPAHAPGDILAITISNVARIGQQRGLMWRLGARETRVRRLALIAGLVALAVVGAAVVAGALQSTPEPIDATGAFVPGPDRAVGRGGGSATVVLNGRVLVVGGESEAGVCIAPEDSVEIWSPDGSRGFDLGHPLSEARTGHSATRLRDGRVLIVGGYCYTDEGLTLRQTAEVWDPATGEWTAAGTLTVPRSGHTAVLLNDGRVLIAGGTGPDGPDTKPIESLEVWDPVSSTFEQAGTTRDQRFGDGAALLPDGRVLLVGDTGAQLWDPSTMKVVAAGTLREPRYFSTVTSLLDGRVAVIGGLWGSDADMLMRSSIETWNPATGSFRVAGWMNDPRTRATATVLPDGRVLIVGGSEVDFSAEVWDPSTGLASRTGPSRRIYNGATATLLDDGRVLFTAGVGPFGKAGRHTELWDPTINPPPPGLGPPQPTPTPKPQQVGG
ncbi:MAG TPA: kelch repeat-containing protein [Candidatus Limnocylindrales bacterium]|nr:kelch repeat-containing protein [Candidatus Limnocylindrales bacterium]